MIKLNKSSYNYKKYFFKKLSPNIIQTHKSNWLVVDPTNKLIEIETTIPYISIFFWLNLILESDLKKKILKKKPINSNTSVYDKNFKPSSIFDVESIKKKNIIFQEDETPFILSIYIDDQAYDSSRKKSVKAVYLVVENFETGSRLKDKTIFLLMNIPKNVPIYNLTAPLPFVKEIFQLSKMNCLYKHKIKIIFHQIIGDSVEQQKAAGKLSSSGITMCRSCSLNKKDIFFNLGKTLTLENPSNDLNESSNTDSLSNSDSNTSSNSKINSVLNSTTKSNLKHDNYSFHTLNSDNKSQNSNFFDFDVKTLLRDPMQIKTIQKEYILQFFRSGDYQKTIIDFEDRKRKTGVLHQNCNFWLHFFGFDSCDFSRFSICWAHLLLEGLFKDGLYSIKQRLNSQISTISKKLDSLNTHIKFINLPLNPFNKPKDLTAIECLELSMVLGLYYFHLKPNLDTKDHDINMKQIADIRKKRIKNISMKYYIEKEEEKIKAVNKKKREEQKFKRFRRIEITFNSHLFKVGNFVYTFDNEYLFIREIIQNSSKDTFILVQKIKAEINKRFFYFENPRKFYLIQPDDFRNIINFIPDTWSDCLCKEDDQERDNTSNSTEKMEIEKEHDISENQSNSHQATQDLIEIDIESKETKENVLKRQIIEMQNQIDPRVFKINLHMNQKLLEYFCNDESSQDKTNEIGKQIKISIIADNFYDFNDDSHFELLKKIKFIQNRWFIPHLPRFLNIN
ncbi:hypothetical protein M0813_01562 [Anaeramoeba flamelloides]|uniref:Uncharacterized protein n=1 Tax=Anaeramoeba flamelloides TaxID=1746091 RepID=A0ABQ8Z4G1_9EUKA|nr:hypothetical protein M0813_01562 [Anaeramoeba flamelloides]